jgi:hypothetical protein
VVALLPLAAVAWLAAHYAGSRSASRRQFPVLVAGRLSSLLASLTLACSRHSASCRPTRRRRRDANRLHARIAFVERQAKRKMRSPSARVPSRKQSAHADLVPQSVATPAAWPKRQHLDAGSPPR